MIKPANVEPGQVWMLEEVGDADHPRAPRFCMAFLVVRLTVLEAFGLELDYTTRWPCEPDGTVCIDYLENLLHEGERLRADWAFRWRFVA